MLGLDYLVEYRGVDLLERPFDDVELALDGNFVGIDSRRETYLQVVVLGVVVDVGCYVDPLLAFAEGDGVDDLVVDEVRASVLVVLCPSFGQFPGDRDSVGRLDRCVLDQHDVGICTCRCEHCFIGDGGMLPGVADLAGVLEISHVLEDPSRQFFADIQCSVRVYFYGQVLIGHFAGCGDE